MRQWWAEFLEAWSYVRDPHEWERRIKIATWNKFAERPAIYRIGNDFVVHPALERKVRTELERSKVDTVFGFSFPFGPQIAISVYAVQKSPSDGWPDVVVPERPRLRP